MMSVACNELLLPVYSIVYIAYCSFARSVNVVDFRSQLSIGLSSSLAATTS